MMTKSFCEHKGRSELTHLFIRYYIFGRLGAASVFDRGALSAAIEGGLAANDCVFARGHGVARDIETGRMSLHYTP